MSLPINRVRPLLSTSVDADNLDPINFVLLKKLEAAAYYIRIINFSVVPIIISYDDEANPGKIPHDYVMPDESLCLNFQTNKQIPGNKALLAKGTSIYMAGENTPIGRIVFTGYTSEAL